MIILMIMVNIETKSELSCFYSFSDILILLELPSDFDVLLQLVTK